MRLRLLPLAVLGAGLLILAKGERLFSLPRFSGEGRGGGVTSIAVPAVAPLAAIAQPAPAAPPTEAVAERAVLEALRARRAELESREQSAAAREVMVTAAERRLAARVEELTVLQSRLEALERERAAREDAGLRGLVRLYEGMRPRDAALIFDELEMPVLLPIADRMREAKAAPILGAMRPDRARALTAELARLRAERVERR